MKKLFKRILAFSFALILSVPTPVFAEEGVMADASCPSLTSPDADYDNYTDVEKPEVSTGEGDVTRTEQISNSQVSGTYEVFANGHVRFTISAMTNTGNPIAVTLSDSSDVTANIKEVVLGVKITSIPSKAFFEWRSLESIKGTGVTSIGEYALYGTNIEHLCFKYSFPSLTTIGKGIFSNVGYDVNGIPARLKWIELENITTIEDGAFFNCRNLVVAEDLGNLEVVGNSAFDNCELLRSIKGATKLESVGERAFFKCSSLDGFNIPTLTEIGRNSFSNAFNAGRDIDIVLSDDSSKSVTIGYGAFSESGLKSFTCEASIEAGEHAFGGCTLLEEVSSESFKVMGSSCFTACHSLESFTCADTLEEIPDRCFTTCDKLTDFNISSSVTKIGNNAFQDAALDKFDFSNLTHIGNYAFYNVDPVEGTIPVNLTNAIEVGEFAFKESRLIDDVYIDKLDIINTGAFENSSITSLTNKGESINDSTIVSIEDNAFKDCTELKNVKAIKVESIGESAFEGCTSLKEVNAECINVLGDYSFKNCRSLIGIDLSKLNTLGKDSFVNCNSLVTIVGSQVALADGTYAYYLTDELTPVETVIIGDKPNTFDKDLFEEQSNRTVISNKVIMVAEYTGQTLYEEENGSRQEPSKEDFEVKVKVYTETTPYPVWEYLTTEGFDIDFASFITGASNSVTISYSDVDAGVSAEVEVEVPSSNIEYEVNHSYSNFEVSYDNEAPEGTLLKDLNVVVTVEKFVEYNSGRTETSTVTLTMDDWSYVDTTFNQPIQFGDNFIVIQWTGEGNDESQSLLSIKGTCIHKETHQENVNVPTCESDGSYDSVCNQCLETVDEDVVLERLGHDFVEDSTDELGITTYVCTRDDSHTYTSDEVINETLTEIQVLHKGGTPNIKLYQNDTLNKSDFTIKAKYEIELNSGISITYKNLDSSLFDWFETGLLEDIGDSYTVKSGTNSITFKTADKESVLEFDALGDATIYEVTGIVQDYDMTPIANYYVCLDSLENCVQTDEEGMYSFKNVTEELHVLYFYEELPEVLTTVNTPQVTFSCGNNLAVAGNISNKTYWQLLATTNGSTLNTTLTCVGSRAYVRGNISANKGSVEGRYVFIDSLANYTTTDFDGNFSIQASTGEHTLYITKLKELPMARALNIDDNDILAKVDFFIDRTGNVTYGEDDTDFTATNQDGTELVYNLNIGDDEVLVETPQGGNEQPPAGDDDNNNQNQGGQQPPADDDEEFEPTPNPTPDPDGDKKYGGIRGYMTYNSGSYNPVGKLLFLNSSDRYTTVTKTGYYSFSQLAPGSYTLYFTKYKDVDEVDISKQLEEQAEIIVYFTVGSKGTTVFKSSNVLFTGTDVKTSKTTDEDTGVLNVSFTIGKANNGNVEYNGEGIRVKGTLSSKNGLFANRMILLDNYDTWTVCDPNGAFYFDYVTQGDHILYITQNIKSSMLGTTGPVDDAEPCYIKIKFNLYYDRAEKLRYTTVLESTDYTTSDYSWTPPSFDEDGLKLSSGVLNYTFLDNSSTSTNKSGVEIEGSINSANFTVGSKVALLDTYNRWVILNSEGGFKFEEVEDGEHILYFTKSKKSELLAEEGEVKAEEPIVAKFRITVADETIQSVKLIYSEDSTSWTYSISDNMDAVKINVKDVKKEEVEEPVGVKITGSIGGNADSYSGITALLNVYDNWSVTNSSGQFSFEDVEDGTHILYLTKSKRSALKSDSGEVNYKEPLYAKVRITIAEGDVTKVLFLDGPDDVTMDYNISNSALKLTFDDNTDYPDEEDKKEENKNEDKDDKKSDKEDVDDFKKDDKDKNTSNEVKEEKKDIPIHFLIAYVHDNRTAKGCYIFVDDLLTNYKIPDTGATHCRVPEGEHTIYVTAADPGAIVVAGGDLESTPYLLWKGSVTNTGGKITSFRELAAVKNSIHNIKISPELDSVGLAMVTTSPVYTAIDLTGGKTGSGVVADSITSEESSNNGSSSGNKDTGSNKGNTYGIVGGSSNVEQKETYTIGNSNGTVSKLPQTDIDYLMTVAEDYGLVAVDENANLYIDAVAALDIVTSLDTPEALQLKQHINEGRVDTFVSVFFIMCLVAGISPVIKLRKQRRK